MQAADLWRNAVPTVRAREATLLAMIGSDMAPGILESLLQAPVFGVRGAAVAGLGVPTHTLVVPLIAPLLSDPNWEVRKQALASLGDPGIRSLSNSLVNLDGYDSNMARQVLDLSGSHSSARVTLIGLLTDLARTLILPGEWAALGYFLVGNSFYTILSLAATWEMREHVLKTKGERLWRVLNSGVAPSISMLAPAHNQAGTNLESVQALLAIQYPKLEVAVVHDGSSDGTMLIVLENFDLSPIHPVYDQRVITEPIFRLYRSPIYPQLGVSDKENGGGKADALKAVLNLATV